MTACRSASLAFNHFTGKEAIEPTRCASNGNNFEGPQLAATAQAELSRLACRSPSNTLSQGIKKRKARSIFDPACPDSPQDHKTTGHNGPGQVTNPAKCFCQHLHLYPWAGRCASFRRGLSRMSTLSRPLWHIFGSCHNLPQLMHLFRAWEANTSHRGNSTSILY